MVRKFWALLRDKALEPIASPEKPKETKGSDGFQEKVELPLNDFLKNRVSSGQIEFMNDEDLCRLNSLLPWRCFTVDSKGRRFGNAAWKGKRDQPQVVPDDRVIWLDQHLDLSHKTVLEFGCFEGIHTIALAQRAKKVYAVDSRIENVVKTIVRTNLFGFSPTVFLCDVERKTDMQRLPIVDVLHHVGVLYHLKDPIGHLKSLGDIVRQCILLDTHYATPAMVGFAETVYGETYQYYKYNEGGRREVFSGMYDHAKWLLLDDIYKILHSIGFSHVRIYNDVKQRNGPRVTLLAARPSLQGK